MFTIGEFARAGRVSVRMLRHYDAIGLLRPARVDDATGYRYYGVDQLGRLNHVVALKDLGFSLQDVDGMADGDVDVAHLRRMFEARRSELREQIASDTARLTGIEARLRSIESENTMITEGITVTRVPSIRVAELQAVAASWEPVSISPVVQPLCEDLYGRLAAAGVQPVGTLIAHYEPAEDGSSVIVHAAVPVSIEPSDSYDFAVVDLPEVTAATAVHHGSMDSCLYTYQAIARWVEANGHDASNLGREVYRVYGEGECDGWRTDIQIPLKT